MNRKAGQRRAVFGGGGVWVLASFQPASSAEIGDRYGTHAENRGAVSFCLGSDMCWGKSTQGAKVFGVEVGMTFTCISTLCEIVLAYVNSSTPICAVGQIVE